MISELKELLHCYDLCTSPTSPVNAELHMWRKRFLDNFAAFTGNKLKNEDVFFSIPCDKFITKTPELWMDSLLTPEKEDAS